MSVFFVLPAPAGIQRIVNAPEIDKLFERLRAAEHGAVIKLGLSDSEKPVEAIIFEPGPQRAPGYEAGVFVMVPSEADKAYYLDPEASKEKGRLMLKDYPMAHITLLEEFKYIRNAPDIKRGGGAKGEAYSKDKGIVDVG